jgi:signal peptidase I
MSSSGTARPTSDRFRFGSRRSQARHDLSLPSHPTSPTFDGRHVRERDSILVAGTALVSPEVVQIPRSSTRPELDLSRRAAACLSEGRLAITWLQGNRATAEVLEGSRVVDVRHDPGGGWRCSCGDPSPCAHVLALQLVAGRAVDLASGRGSRGGAAAVAAGRRELQRGRFLREIGLLLIVALLAIAVKTFALPIFKIPSVSMEPTLRKGDRVLVNRVSYPLYQPRRGDVVVFTDPRGVAAEGGTLSKVWHSVARLLGFYGMSDSDFIKRVIGLPGEIVSIRRGIVFINGRPLREGYLSRTPDLRSYGPIRVPEGTFFVLGDNRTQSNDSRFGLGMIPGRNLVGRAILIVWPPRRAGPP